MWSKPSNPISLSKQEALQKAQQLCSKEEKCISDLKKKFYDWKVNSEWHEEIIDSLITENYINESRYCNAFVADKFKFNKWSKLKIASELRMRKIADVLIKNALGEVEDTLYIEQIKLELQKKIKSFRALPLKTLKIKLQQFAQSRGYERTIVMKVMGQLTYPEPPEEDGAETE